MGGSNSKKARSNQAQNGNSSHQTPLALETTEDPFAAAHHEKENTFTSPTPPPVTSPKAHVTSSGPIQVTSSSAGSRPPLRFDQNNTVVERKPPPGFAPSSNNQLSSRQTDKQTNRQFGSNISSVNQNPDSLQFNKSQNFYNQPRDKSGKFNSHSGNGFEASTPSHYSGVYNRYHDSDKNEVASLLKKDKFSLLGSQLHQQESQIFSRSTLQQSSTPPTFRSPSSTAPSFSAPSSTAPSFSSLPVRFDPNKFRKVNETSAPCLTMTSGLRSQRSGLGAGPLDDRDEELIASIEREFEFSY